MIVPGLFRLDGGPGGCGVIAAALGVAGTAPDRPHVLPLNGDVDRGQPVGVVAAHWGGDDVKAGVADAVDSQLHIRAEHEGPQVQRRVGLTGDPGGFFPHKGPDGLHKVLRGQLRQTHPLAGVPEPATVVQGTE